MITDELERRGVFLTCWLETKSRSHATQKQSQLMLVAHHRRICQSRHISHTLMCKNTHESTLTSFSIKCTHFLLFSIVYTQLASRKDFKTNGKLLFGALKITSKQKFNTFCHFLKDFWSRICTNSYSLVPEVIKCFVFALRVDPNVQFLLQPD